MSIAGGARVPGTPAVFGLIVAVTLLCGPVIGFEAEIVQQRVQPLGLHECTYGPAFWCKNLTNAAGCNAVKHCIQTTWETQAYPEDNDDVCTICKNMVKEARDTLTSNATLDELKQVFYGSCQLLPLKVIKTECKKLADDFIPELVDTLASEMDPNVVCTVSGLCNNARIDKLLLENKEKVQPSVLPNTDDELNDCEKCAIVMDKGEKLVETMSSNYLFRQFLRLCGELSSYSDVCSSILIRYDDEIINSFRRGFSKRDVCMLSGVCSEAFHPHADGYEKSKNALMGVEISNAGERGRIQVQKPSEVSDELTCQFCEAMVKHLRDILIANTTEDQFLDVLKGLCKQTKTFSDECLSLVNEDYTRIYQYLMSELDGKLLCSAVGICPKAKSTSVFDVIDSMIPMYPLLPVDLIQTQESLQIDDDSYIPAKKEENHKKPVLVVDEIPPKVQAAKPSKKSPIIDLYYNQVHVVVNSVDMPSDKTVCFLCQSILNYVQQVVTDPKSEEEIRSALEKSCAVIPSSFEPQCKQFVDQYGDAFISLIAQEVDPSIICPELKLCPVTDMSFALNHYGKKPNSNCPLCVIIMSTLESEISNKDTERIIQKKLEKLCGKLPLKWKSECSEFVSSRLQSILDMFVAQVKPEEICVLLEVCKPKTMFEKKIDSNIISATSGDVTVVFPGYNIGQLLANNYKTLEEVKEVPTPFCLVCTVVMKYLNSEVKDKSNQEEIESVLDSMCSILPNVEERECQQFVDANYQSIIKAIQIGTNPTVSCLALMVCVEKEPDVSITAYAIEKQPAPEPEEIDISDDCSACEAFVQVFGDRLKNKTVKIEDIDLAEICHEVDVIYKEQCLEMIESYAPSFKNVYNRMPTWMMCEELSLCLKDRSLGVQEISQNCLNGFGYWCASGDTAKECKAEMVCDAFLSTLYN